MKDFYISIIGLTSICFFSFLPSLANAQLNKIVEIKGQWSNIYLIRGDKPVLIDSGSPEDYDTIVKEIAAFGISPEEVAAIVLTHGHGDHAGTAARFQANRNTKIIMGKADVEMANKGQNNDLKPMNLTALLLRPLVDFKFPSFFPDIIVDSEYELTSFGVPAKIIAMGGHTPGSLVVNYHDGSSFVGDMMAGGILGGFFFPFYPSHHYYHDDRERNQSNIEKLVRAGTRTFYTGHGGPLDPKAVIKAFRLPQ